MKVLVTGANGFLGAWLTKTLVEKGFDVFALVRKTSDLSELDGINCKFLYGDVTDKKSLLESFKNIDTVFHLAGVVAYTKFERATMERVNVQGTANVIAAVRELKVRKLVYLSSVVAVGASFSPSTLDESAIFNLHHLNLGYFETKHQAENLVIQACKENIIDAVILNPSTIYGPGDAKKGSRKTQLKVARGTFKFYPIGGVNVVAVEDVVNGILSAWEIGRKGERYILAGENLTIKELFELIAAEAQASAPSYKMPTVILHLLGMIGDALTGIGFKLGLSRENAYTATLYHWFDSTKARKELNFHPRSAKEAIHNSIVWSRNNGLLRK